MSQDSPQSTISVPSSPSSSSFHLASRTAIRISNLPSYQFNILASTLAAISARLITHPLDTIKTRVQVGTHKSHAIRSTLQTILKTDGIRGLYRGLGVSIAFSVPALGVYLYTYDSIKDYFGGGQNIWGVAIYEGAGEVSKIII